MASGHVSLEKRPTYDSDNPCLLRTVLVLALGTTYVFKIEGWRNCFFSILKKCLLFLRCPWDHNLGVGQTG